MTTGNFERAGRGEARGAHQLRDALNHLLRRITEQPAGRLGTKASHHFFCQRERRRAAWAGGGLDAGADVARRPEEAVMHGRVPPVHFSLKLQTGLQKKKDFAEI